MRNWDKKYFELAEYISTWSKDRSTKIGAIIVKNNDVISTGFNGFPIGANDDVEERHQRPLKYSWTEHSERNAIYSAAKHGKSTNGCTIYVKWFPCADCARAIIQSGIKTVLIDELNYLGNRGFYTRWEDSIKAADKMFEEAGIRIVMIKFTEKI